jgi:hypothetical protein
MPLALITLLAGSPAFAQQGTPTDWVPSLVLRVVPARPDGDAAPGMLGSRKLVKGQPVFATVWTGPSMCSLGIGSGEPPAQAGAWPNVWKTTADYLGEENGRHQIRVTSGFTRLGGQDSSGTTVQTLSLVDGDRVVLDALTGPVDERCRVHTVTFDAQLVMQTENPALAQARYAADLWLVHRDPSGQEQREHIVTNVSADGPAMPFMFSPLPFQIPQVDSRQGSAEAFIRVSGLLRVRPRSNGTVAIDLDINRPLFDLGYPDRPAAPGIQSIHPTLTTNDGETVAVEFPPPSSGSASLALAGESTGVRVDAQQRTTASAPTDAVQVKNDRLVLYTFQFFKGHSTRLLITLKRLP